MPHEVRHGRLLNRAWTLLRRLSTSRGVTVEKGEGGLLAAGKRSEGKVSPSRGSRGCPSLAVPKASLDGVWSSLGCERGPCPGQGCTEMTLRSFQPKPSRFYDLNKTTNPDP